MSVFSSRRVLRFSDCDPAGIVFFPQYFVMALNVVEEWVDALGIGYAELVGRRRTGLPTVRLETDFTAISRMGETVAFHLDVERLGDKSLTLRIRCEGADGSLRMSLRQVLVTTSLATHRSVAIPADLRTAIERAIGQAPPAP